MVTTRRYVPGFTGLLAEVAVTGVVSSTVVELTGLHGDVLRTTTPSATLAPDGVGVWADEFGRVLDATGSLTTGPRYGWLGGKQRATDTGVTGLTLMGVRLYSPIIGRFLSTDPVYGGNANTYTYPVDPVNSFDLDGRMLKRDPNGYCSRSCQNRLEKALEDARSHVRSARTFAHWATVIDNMLSILGSIPLLDLVCRYCAVAFAALGVVAGWLWMKAGKVAKGVATMVLAVGAFFGGRKLTKLLERYGDILKNTNYPVGAFLTKTFGPVVMSDISLILTDRL